MGSLLCGGRGFIEEARRQRKMLGGGVRQGGVVAAAGLVALEYLPRLGEDHHKLQVLARGLRELGGRPSEPETNILLLAVANPQKAAADLENAGVRTLPVGGALRFITHRDLSLEDIAEALERMAPCADSLGGG